MTIPKHGVTDSGRPSTVLPQCCQAWAAEQARPWTHRPHSPIGAAHHDRPPRAHGAAAPADGAAAPTGEERSSDGTG
jgi:hypothetical protein